MKFEVIKKGNQDILYFDYSKLTESEIIKSLKESNKIMQNYPKSSFRVLINYTGVTLNKNVMVVINSEESKKAIKRVNKSAVIGLNKITEIILKTFNFVTGKGVKPVKDDIEGMMYLSE